MSPGLRQRFYRYPLSPLYLSVQARKFHPSGYQNGSRERLGITSQGLRQRLSFLPHLRLQNRCHPKVSIDDFGLSRAVRRAGPRDHLLTLTPASYFCFFLTDMASTFAVAVSVRTRLLSASTSTAKPSLSHRMWSCMFFARAAL